jgi:pimeloyl-ACP methyl ester carboxylesterase
VTAILEGRRGSLAAGVAVIVIVALVALPAVTARASRAAPGAAPVLPLHECRLEHPLKLASIAARCGTLTVPLDPSAPTGLELELAVAVVPALDRRAHAAPLFVLAGGPGQAASDLYTSYAGAFARINREHDIVLLDQRGTGRSARLDCRFPEDWLESAALLPQLTVATRECLAQLGDRVRFFTSSVAVQDLERLRRALGYETIDLYGSSYGTRMAELYVRRFPHSSHAMILDGVTYPEQIIGPDTPLDGERALDLQLARCAASSDCAAAFPRLGAELTGLRERYGSLRTRIMLEDPVSGVPTPVDFNKSLLSASIRLLSYNSSGAALLPTLVHEAAQERVAPLAAQTLLMAHEIRAQLAAGMQNSVICSEDEPFFGTLDRARLAATYQGTEQIDALEVICSLWPRGPVDADLHAPLASEVPTLLLSGEADPVTPPAYAEHLARTLTRHRHLVLAGEGHGQIATGCIPSLMARFLDHPDPEALDASCLDAHRPQPFFVTSVGPAP